MGDGRGRTGGTEDGRKVRQERGRGGRSEWNFWAFQGGRAPSGIQFLHHNRSQQEVLSPLKWTESSPTERRREAAPHKFGRGRITMKRAGESEEGCKEHDAEGRESSTTREDTRRVRCWPVARPTSLQ